jgi:hypothetical protein
MNRIEFIKQNGGLGRTAATEDVVSGLIMSVGGALGEELEDSGFEAMSEVAQTEAQLYTESFQDATLESGITLGSNVSVNTGLAASGEGTQGGITMNQNKYVEVALPNLAKLEINANITGGAGDLQVEYKKGDNASFTVAGLVNFTSNNGTGAAVTFKLQELFPNLITSENITVRLTSVTSGKEVRIYDIASSVIVPTTATNYVATLKFFEQLAQQYNIVEKPIDTEEMDTEDIINANAINAIVYHVREFFRMSPTGTLYLAIVADGEITGANIKSLQYYSNGAIRQVGILTPTLDNVEDYQVACTGVRGIQTGLFDEHQPLVVLVAANGNNKLFTDYLGEAEILVSPDRSNVSVLIGADVDAKLAAKIGDWVKYGCLGTLLGAVSKAAVNESVAWVAKFPLGLKVPGLSNGTELSSLSQSQKELLNDARYIFVIKHVGDADNYFNDSHNLDVTTSDYAFIENVRTMDKAIRGIRKNLLPSLNAPLYVDATTGKMSASTVKSLEVTAQRALEDMEKAGELSGYVVEIDPNQNMFATSTVEIVIKNVPVGVMRVVRVKIGFTTQI